MRGAVLTNMVKANKKYHNSEILSYLILTMFFPNVSKKTKNDLISYSLNT